MLHIHMLHSIIKRRFGSGLILMLLGAVVSVGPGCSAKSIDPNRISTPEQVLQTCQSVARWQVQNQVKIDKGSDNWVWGAWYTGLADYALFAQDAQALADARRIGDAVAWKHGRTIWHADDHAAMQLYLEMYLQDGRPVQLADSKKVFDWVLAHPTFYWPPATQPTTRRAASQSTTKPAKKPGPPREYFGLYHWCDALFMSPPAAARLSAATGDPAYLNHAINQWKITSARLYDTTDHLYWRDTTFVGQRNKNGNKTFWSRGNGWVFGGLVRVLQYMPENHPDRPFLLQQYREMAEKLASIQQSDGYWRSNLVDPKEFTMPETTGTGFFVYGIAWGVNQGILDRSHYWPIANRGWNALCAATSAEGKLGWAQSDAAAPGASKVDGSRPYASGAMLLAGTEMAKGLLSNKSSEATLKITNPLDTVRKNETLSIAWQDVADHLPNASADRLVAIDALSGRWLTTQVVDADQDGKPEELLLQPLLGPKETRSIILRELAVPSPIKPIARTFARVVPERKDDFAWENDRIAHRMYGPALQATGEVSSGIDVWVKSVRTLVIDKWYKLDDYHVDHGEGLDCYKVDPSRGCGGTGVLVGDQLVASKNYTKATVLASGPIRTVFRLDYAPWKAGTRNVTETKTISLDAGSNLSRVESKFVESTSADALDVAIGIVERAGKGVVNEMPQKGVLGYWEPTTKDGTIGCGIVIDPNMVTQMKQFKDAKFTQQLVLTKVKPGETLVYSIGAGWDRGGDFVDADSWFNYLQRQAEIQTAPIQVNWK